MKQKQKQKKSVMYIFREGAAGLAVIMMMGLFPLYYQNNYIDISNAKLSFFRVCSIGLIIAAALFLCMELLQQYKETMQQKNKKQKQKQKKMQSQHEGQMGKGQAFRQWICGLSATTWFAVVFAAGILVATVFSVNPQESWLGLEGRKLGAITWLLCIAMYGILAKYLKPGKWTAWVFLAANIIVCFLAILNFWAVDPLNMYENLASDQYGGFISTIGNINACASYLCMIIPAGIALYTLTKDIYLRAVSAVFLLLGFCAGYCAHSEGWLLGLGVAFLVFLWFGMREHNVLRFLEVCGIFWISSVLMKVMMLIAGSTEFVSYMYVMFKGDKLQNGIMLNGYVLAAEGILIAGLLFLVWNREKSGKELPYLMLRKWIFGVLAAVAVVGILVFIAANLNRGTWEGAFSALEHLRLQDSFGSSRGYIWRTTVQSWLEMPLWDKITGYGVNCYHMFIQQYGGAEVTEYFGGALLVDAHNEFMQILTTMGLLGVVGYFGLLISTAVSAAKMMPKRPALLMGVAVVCSYLAQGLVNNPTVFLTPYLFLMLGIIKSMEKVEHEGE